MQLERIRPRLLALTLLASSSALAEGVYTQPQTTPPPPGSSSAPATVPPPAATTAPGTPGSTAPYGSATPPANGTGTPATTGTRGASTVSPPGDDTPIVLVVPTSMATDPTLANGCWARLYDSTDFRGTLFPIAGGVSIPNNRAGYITGFEMGRNFDSLMLGAHASLTVWDEANYRNRSTTFGPGQAIPNLDSRMGNMEEIRSLKLTCTP